MNYKETYNDALRSRGVIQLTQALDIQKRVNSSREQSMRFNNNKDRIKAIQSDTKRFNSLGSNISINC